MHIEVETGKKLLDMQGHNGDVAALSLRPNDTNTFVTGIHTMYILNAQKVKIENNIFVFNNIIV